MSGEDIDGITRLRRFANYVFAKHDQSQLPPPPLELVEWAQDTTLAAFAGAIIGGGRQWLEERQAGPPTAPPDTPTPAHAARAIAEEQTQRLVRVFDASVRGGFRIGGVAALYYATQLLSSIYRAKHDFLNSAYGGMVAGAVFGTLSTAVAKQRFRGLVLGAALGGTMGIPVGILQQKVVELLPQQHKEELERRAVRITDIVSGETPVVIPEYTGRHSDNTTEMLIRNFERSLADSPTQQKSSPPTTGDGVANDDKQEKTGKWGWFSKKSTKET